MKEKLNTALNQTTTMDILQFIVNKMDGKVITFKCVLFPSKDGDTGNEFF